MNWKAGDEAIAPGATQPVVISSIEGATATVVIGQGKRKQVRRFSLRELKRPGEVVTLDASAGGVIAGSADAAMTELAFWDEQHLDFDAVFVEQARLRSTAGRDERAVISLATAGKLGITSGRLTACDPRLFDLALPFARGVSCGIFAVELARARGLNAAARIEFEIRHRRVDRWEPAVFQDEDRGGSNVFGVDYGRACFADFEHRGQSDAAAHRVTFESGAGDGGYACYFGLIDDRIVTAVIDFGVLYSTHAVELTFPGIRGFSSGTLNSVHLPGVTMTFTNTELQLRVSIVGLETVMRRLLSAHRLVDAGGATHGELRGGSSRSLHSDEEVTIETSFAIVFESVPPSDSELRLQMRRTCPFVPSER